MKKTITIVTTMIVTIIVLMVTFTACSGFNKQIFDLVYDYDYAWIELPGGDIIEGKIEKWTDYEDGDQIQVQIDGNIYLTDTTRCVMRKDKE